MQSSKRQRIENLNLFDCMQVIIEQGDFNNALDWRGVCQLTKNLATERMKYLTEEVKSWSVARVFNLNAASIITCDGFESILDTARESLRSASILNLRPMARQWGHSYFCREYVRSLRQDFSHCNLAIELFGHVHGDIGVKLFNFSSGLPPTNSRVRWWFAPPWKNFGSQCAWNSIPTFPCMDAEHFREMCGTLEIDMFVECFPLLCRTAHIDADYLAVFLQRLEQFDAYREKIPSWPVRNYSLLQGLGWHFTETYIEYSVKEKSDALGCIHALARGPDKFYSISWFLLDKAFSFSESLWLIENECDHMDARMLIPIQYRQTSLKKFFENVPQTYPFYIEKPTHV